MRYKESLYHFEFLEILWPKNRVFRPFYFAKCDSSIWPEISSAKDSFYIAEGFPGVVSTDENVHLACAGIVAIHITFVRQLLHQGIFNLNQDVIIFDRRGWPLQYKLIFHWL